MNVEEIRKKVRSLCEDAGLQFFFAVPNASEWAVTDCEHLRKIVSYHKELETLPLVTPTQKWIPVSEKYEHHIDHTDCIWHGNNSGCPVTCSQYRDGWNDAMDYIFKNGDGYRPYRRNENG